MNANYLSVVTTSKIHALREDSCHHGVADKGLKCQQGTPMHREESVRVRKPLPPQHNAIEAEVKAVTESRKAGDR
jgi:hypothetical protein